MGTFDNVSVYEKLGVHASINAVGSGTVVGGAGPPDFVREKMEEVSTSFTDMGELLTKSGEFVAELMGTEAAFVTSGGAAALALSAASLFLGLLLSGCSTVVSRIDQHTGRGTGHTRRAGPERP